MQTEKEYDYEIAAADGKILSADVEVLDNGTSARAQWIRERAAREPGAQDSSAPGDAGNAAGQDQQTQNGAGRWRGERKCRGDNGAGDLDRSRESAGRDGERMEDRA